MIPALRELEDIVALENAGQRLMRLDSWKRKWLEQLSHVATVDELDFAVMDDKSRLEDYLARSTAHELGKLLIKEPGLSWVERDRTDAEGRILGDLVPPASLQYFSPYGRTYERRHRRILVVRREPR